MGIFVVRERMELCWGQILPTLVGSWWCWGGFFGADAISGAVKGVCWVSILMTIMKLAFCWGKGWNSFAGGLRAPLGWGWGCPRMDMVSSTPAPLQGTAELEKCTQERTNQLLPVTAEVTSVWKSLVGEGRVGGDLARPSPETSSSFSPVQHRTLELGSAGESHLCPHPYQMMEWGWILLLASSFTLLLPSCGGFKAGELSLWQEIGCHRPAPLGGGPYTDNRAGGQNRNKRRGFLHKMDLSRKEEIRDLDPKHCQRKDTE